MSLHRNAKLGLAGRFALDSAVEGGASLRSAAAAFSVSPATAHRWWHRWLAAGEEGRSTLSCLFDRSSRPHGSPRRLAGREIPEERWDRLEQLERFAEERGVTLLEVAIGGLAAMPAVASVIAGAANLVRTDKAEGLPVVVVRGLRHARGDGSAAELVMPAERDLFR